MTQKRTRKQKNITLSQETLDYVNTKPNASRYIEALITIDRLMMVKTLEEYKGELLEHLREKLREWRF